MRADETWEEEDAMSTPPMIFGTQKIPAPMGT